MVRLLGSTCAFGFEAICLGSVMACGAEMVCAATNVSLTKVLIRMTIAKRMNVRMRVEDLTRIGEIKVYQSEIIRLASDAREAQPQAFAALCISTVLQVLSAAWQISSSRQSTHFGLRAKQSLRPCQMT